MMTARHMPPFAALVGAAVTVAACSKSDTSPEPAHNAVTTAMPDAASTPGAQGPATVAPHATPPPDGKLPSPVPPGNGPSPQANPADHPQ